MNTQEQIVNTQVPPIVLSTQSTMEHYVVRPFKAYHFVSSCNWDYPDFKGITSKIDVEKPYFFVKELGKDGGEEHHHLYFHSPKSLNTVKKYLLEHKFLNLKYTDPNHSKYNKYNDPRHFRDLENYNNIGCLVYLSKGKTNHMCCRDDLEVKPVVSLSNIEDEGPFRDLYEFIINEMREKREILLKDKVDNKEKKTQIELFLWFEYIENCRDSSELPDLIGRFFESHYDIIHSEHKGFSFYKSALKKLYPREYGQFCTNCVLKKLKLLTEL